MSETNKPATVHSVDDVVLLPCPFCGGSVEIVHCEDECCGAKPRWVQCDCGCELGGIWGSDEDAVRSWNRRDGDLCRQGCKIKRAVKEMNDSLTSDY